MTRNIWILAWPQLGCQTKIPVTYGLCFSFKKKNIQEAIKSGFYKEKEVGSFFPKLSYLD